MWLAWLRAAGMKSGLDELSPAANIPHATVAAFRLVISIACFVRSPHLPPLAISLVPIVRSVRSYSSGPREHPR